MKIGSVARADLMGIRGPGAAISCQTKRSTNVACVLRGIAGDCLASIVGRRAFDYRGGLGGGPRSSIAAVVECQVSEQGAKRCSVRIPVCMASHGCSQPGRADNMDMPWCRPIASCIAAPPMMETVALGSLDERENVEHMSYGDGL
jgi:hypothetical protein